MIVFCCGFRFCFAVLLVCCMGCLWDWILVYGCVCWCFSLDCIVLRVWWRLFGFGGWSWFGLVVCFGFGLGLMIAFGVYG